MRERLQKIIAQAGISSRRAAEELITTGRVRVNGKVVTELGTQADSYNDKVEVDGKRLVAEKLIYAVLHKPKNVVSTMSDPEGRPTVAELLRPLGARLYPVGRLDFATSGVLLATNDGDFSQGLLHPKKEVPKMYVVKVQGQMEDPDLDIWRNGIDLEDGRTLPAKVRFLRHEAEKTWFEITIREGRNQQIRRMGEATGFFVMRLARLSFAGIGHVGLRPGQARSLTGTELNALKDTYGVPKKVPHDVRLPDAPTARRDSRGRVAAERRAVAGDERAARRALAPPADAPAETRPRRGRSDRTPQPRGAETGEKRGWVAHATDAAERHARKTQSVGTVDTYKPKHPKIEPAERKRAGKPAAGKPAGGKPVGRKPGNTRPDETPDAKPRRGKGRR